MGSAQTRQRHWQDLFHSLLTYPRINAIIIFGVFSRQFVCAILSLKKTRASVSAGDTALFVW